jgi:hypothetical protein
LVINTWIPRQWIHENYNGTPGLGDFYSGKVEVIKGSAFVNSRGVEIQINESRERLVRDSLEILHRD